MTLDRLIGPRRKIERADQHIRNLASAIESFHQANPYQIVREKDSKTGHMQWKIKISGGSGIPHQFSLITGDVIHNLRSSLDLLWCQLVLANGKSIADSDMFVISDDRNKFESAFKGIRKRIAAPAREVIVALKPYHGGNDGLWMLNKLDIVDKHRLLLAVWASNEAIVMRMKMDVPWLDEPVIAPPIGLRPASRRVDHDSVLFADQSGDPPGEHYEEPEFRIEIALDEPPIVECEPIVPFLSQLRSTVDGVMDRFEPVLTA